MEIWSFETNTSTFAGDNINAFDPLLLKTKVNECIWCEKNCDNGQCVLIHSIEHCLCDPGYTNKKNDTTQTCDDINECDIFNCGPGICINNDGSYICDCKSGFANKNSDLSQPCGKFEPNFT